MASPGIDAELLNQMEVQRPLLVAVDLVGRLGGGVPRHPHVDKHLNEFGRSACGCFRNERRSTRTSESICSLAVVTDVYSPSAMENAPASNRPRR